MLRYTERLTPQQERYRAALDDIARRYGRLDDKTIRQFSALLQSLRKDISAEILTSQGFETYRLKALRDNLGLMIDRFEADLGKSLRDSIGQSYKLGGLSVTEPLTVAGIQGAFYQPSTAQLNAILDFSADLVKSISADMRGQINNALTRAVLGQQTPFKAMQEITRVLGIKARDGVWGRRRRPQVVKGVAARGEAILRTEMQRVNNLATHSQARVTARQMPEIRKRWVATGDSRTRISHLMAHVDTLDSPIPIDEPFDVGGQSLMYPVDPAGSASETVNCRCRMVIIHPEIGAVETSGDRAVKRVVKDNEQPSV